MRWRELITGIHESRWQQPGSASEPKVYGSSLPFPEAQAIYNAPNPGIAAKPQFYSAASAATVADAEAILNATLPASLRSLLSETNGVMEMIAIDGGEWMNCEWLVWPIERIANKEGVHDREFRNLVFFGGAGVDGILFAFPVEDGVCAPRVVVWHPIMDELDDVAPSLEEFLRGWLTGTIAV
jgi:SMI1-KNR4 cell-wall